MREETDWEGKTWLKGNHRWVPIFPEDSMVKCIQCGRIETIQKRNYGGMVKCRRLKVAPKTTTSPGRMNDERLHDAG